LDQFARINIESNGLQFPKKDVFSKIQIYQIPHKQRHHNLTALTNYPPQENKPCLDQAFQ